jgi:cbb3-type cytochrome oxidase subunit 3
MSNYSETHINDATKPIATIEKDVDVPVVKPFPEKPLSEEPVPKKIPFWLENPNVLFQSFEFFPSEDMTYTQKLNALSRMVIVLTLILYGMTRHFRILVISVVTLAAIYFVYHYHNKNTAEKQRMHAISHENDAMEGFDNPAIASLAQQKIPIPTDVFTLPDSQNPFSNVLMTDYEYNPEKKPAPPSYNENVNDSILEQAKKVVRESNPDQPDITDKLFKSLGEKYIFEQSLRPFYSTSSTTIPNDQEAFAEFCYGSMISCKEGNQFACARNLARYQ